MPAVVLDNLHSLKEFAGREVGVTAWFSITQERIERFAESTEDRQWIHTDGERASKESPYGTTIAHGFLTLSLASHFMKEVIQIRSLRIESCALPFSSSRRLQNSGPRRTSQHKRII